MLVEMIDLVIVQHHVVWVSVISMTVLALKSHHLTILFDVFLEAFETKSVEMTTEALQTVAWTLTSFNMTFQLRNGVGFNVFGFAAPVADLDLVDDSLKQVGLNVSEGILVVSLAMHACWHVPSLLLLVLNQACITHNFATAGALLWIDWHAEADHAAHQFGDLIIVNFIFVFNYPWCGNCRVHPVFGGLVFFLGSLSCRTSW